MPKDIENLRDILPPDNPNYTACFICGTPEKENAFYGVAICENKDNDGWASHIAFIDDDRFKKDMEAQLHNKYNLVLCSPAFPDIRVMVPHFTQLDVQQIHEIFKDVEELVKKQSQKFSIIVKPNPIRS